MDTKSLITYIDCNVSSQGHLSEKKPERSISWCHGLLAKRKVILIKSEPNSVKGALGLSDIEYICKALSVAKENGVPVIFFLDSSGAKLDDGVAIQAAFRELITKAIKFKSEGGRLVFLLGRNVFGGASILAMSGAVRIYSNNTRISMTGPRVLEVDGDDRGGCIESVISRASRMKVDSGAVYCGSYDSAIKALESATFPLSKNDYDEFYSSSKYLCYQGGLTEKVVVTDEGVECIGKEPPSPFDLFSLASAISGWSAGKDIYVSCEWSSHSIKLCHEESLQSKLLYMLAEKIYEKRLDGYRVICLLKENISGGLYISLSAGCDEIVASRGVRVESLPIQIISAIKGAPQQEDGNVSNLLELGVIDNFV